MFDGNGALVWLGVALVLGVVETVTVDFTFLMLAGGALGGSAAAALGAPITVQVIVAAVTAVLGLGFVRPAARRHFRSRRHSGTMGVSALVGQPARVTEVVTGTSGQVSIAGEVWTARSESGDVFAPGESVSVSRIDGATAVVTRAIAVKDTSQ